MAFGTTGFTFTAEELFSTFQIKSMGHFKIKSSKFLVLSLAGFFKHLVFAYLCVQVSYLYVPVFELNSSLFQFSEIVALSMCVERATLTFCVSVSVAFFHRAILTFCVSIGGGFFLRNALFFSQSCSQLMVWMTTLAHITQAAKMKTTFQTVR